MLFVKATEAEMIASASGIGMVAVDVGRSLEMRCLEHPAKGHAALSRKNIRHNMQRQVRHLKMMNPGMSATGRSMAGAATAQQRGPNVQYCSVSTKWLSKAAPRWIEADGKKGRRRNPQIFPVDHR